MQTMQPPTQRQTYYDPLGLYPHLWHYGDHEVDPCNRPAMFPEASYYKLMHPLESCLVGKDWESMTASFIVKGTQKNTNPLHTIEWMQHGKKIITGTSKGEVVIWKNFEHERAISFQHKGTGIYAMCWTAGEKYLLTADKQGTIIYSSKALSEKNKFQAHQDSAIRDICMSPSSLKFCSCSDDRTVRIFDLATNKEEICFDKHNSDVKSCHWHPEKALIASGGKDNHLKLWCPKSGKEILDLQPHNKQINRVRWNPVNGNWLLTGSQDHSIKLFDLRMIRQAECMREFKEHEDKISFLAWHPIKEELFASASHSKSGEIKLWMANYGKLYDIKEAHNNMVWALAWHPSGNILASSGNDFQIRGWARNKPGQPICQAPPLERYL